MFGQRLHLARRQRSYLQAPALHSAGRGYGGCVLGAILHSSLQPGLYSHGLTAGAREAAAQHKRA